MLKRSVALGLVQAALLIFPLLAFSQGAPPSPAATAQTQDAEVPPPVDGWGRPITEPAKSQKSPPAARHDITGTWEPANGFLDGLGPAGAKSMPEDGKPQHELPYTALGLEALKLAKPTIGLRGVLPAESNDPVASCDPQGMPREDLFQLRTTQILQTPKAVFILYEFGRVWRVIWTDGRQLPKNLEPRWFGYSVGKWVDDYTLVAQTSGTDERTWMDAVGRPHSADLLVEERFHRVDQDHLEWTVTINDPQMYTKSWVALDKFPMRLQPSDFDVREMLCAPSEAEQYNKIIASPASEK